MSTKESETQPYVNGYCTVIKYISQLLYLKMDIVIVDFFCSDNFL